MVQFARMLAIKCQTIGATGVMAYKIDRSSLSTHTLAVPAFYNSTIVLILLVGV